MAALASLRRESFQRNNEYQKVGTRSQDKKGYSVCKITEITKGVQVVSEEGSTIHEDSFLRTIGHTISRRNFLARTTGAVGAVAIAKNLAAASGMLVAAYHGATAAYHQQQFDASDGLLKKGYRIRSLSVYRTSGSTLYAAVWTTEGGPAWQAFHGLSGDAYQKYFDQWRAKGYRPVIITATGGGVVGLNDTNVPVFAGVFQKDAAPFTARHNIDSGTFNGLCQWAKQNHHVLRWASIYGGRDRLYAGIWEKVPPNVIWDYKITIAIDGPEQGVPLTMPGQPSLRLAFVTRSPFAEYLAVYRSDQTGDWKERHGMTSNEYQQQHDALKAVGYFPMCVQAGGDPRVAPPHFVAMFEKL